MPFPIAFPTLSSVRRYLAAERALSRRDGVTYDAGFAVYRDTGEYVVDVGVARIAAARRGRAAEDAARAVGGGL